MVEQALAPSDGGFIANDCALGTGDTPALILLTGPNMAGKSTYLRQNALIAVLAQMGAFVPAASAHIGIVDALFSRVGASDDLARGRSTFMVEMIETAAILNRAGERALVILDEIGRGTATYDGLSIAWAAIEHLHDFNRCRTLFATHYHELTTLADDLQRMRNLHIRVREWKGDIVFLHEVAEGAADRSYGVQVAKLAGLPARATARAREVLAKLEAGAGATARAGLAEELPLFVGAAQRNAQHGEQMTAPPDPRAEALRVALEGLDADALSPRAALDEIYRLKAMLNAADEA